MAGPNHLAVDRLVWTYVPNGHAAGVVTGFRDAAGGVVVEQVIRWRTRGFGSLLAMLEAALEEVWRLDAPYAVVLVPAGADHRLEELAARMGFKPYAERDEGTWFVRYRP